MEGSGYVYCCLVGLRKATKLLSQYSRSQGRDTTPRPPKHKAEMLTTVTIQTYSAGSCSCRPAAWGRYSYKVLRRHHLHVSIRT
jgi:hypothetical protein